MEKVFTSIIIDKRKAKKITQEQMAKKLGICRKTYCIIEKGNMSLSQFIDLCRMLDLKIFVIPQEYILG